MLKKGLIGRTFARKAHSRYGGLMSARNPSTSLRIVEFAAQDGLPQEFKRTLAVHRIQPNAAPAIFAQ